MTACAACKTEFQPRRSTARYCGDRCRKAASRGTTGGGLRSFLSVTGHPPTSRPFELCHVTLTSPARRESKRLGRRIVPDEKWPGMYRIRRPDGSLSVMVNLTRAKDALLDYEATKALSAWLPSPPERSRGHQED
jgi:hypothetical protein